MTDSIKNWIEEYFSVAWKEIETNIDFSKYKPISTSSSPHIYEERYEIDDKKYRLLYMIGYDGEPSVEISINDLKKMSYQEFRKWRKS